MRREEGYAGPVPPRSDTVTYPDPAVVFTCKDCARRQLDLGEEELSGHRCQGRCHGDVHEDNRYLPRATFDTLDGDQRIARYAAEYAARGWTLTDISPAYHLPHAAGEAWCVHVRPGAAALVAADHRLAVTRSAAFRRSADTPAPAT